MLSCIHILTFLRIRQRLIMFSFFSMNDMTSKQEQIELLNSEVNSIVLKRFLNETISICVDTNFTEKIR